MKFEKEYKEILTVTAKRKATILNVDDNDAGRYAISKILKKAGFGVIESTNGTEALKLVKEKPNLVILDINLPDIMGFDVCQRIKADPGTSQIPILMLSATYRDIQSTVKALESGAEGFLTLPIEPVVLIAYVKALLRVRQAEKELAQYREHLEQLVQKRTAELETANRQLQQQIAVRRKAEQKLKNTYEKLKITHHQLKESQGQLIQSEKMKTLGSMAAGLAHEMNNPLMGILNYIQYCMKHINRDDKKYTILQDAEIEINRCIDFLNNLLTFVYMGSEGEKKYQKISCAVLFNRVFKLLSYRIEKENVLIKQDISADVPEIWLKVNTIQQVFLNLITNALDAVKNKEKKEISINLKPEGKNLRITVSDNGIGIAPKNLEKIFDPFFTTKPASKGTGLGLPIVANIIKEHKGQITCESMPGLWSKFTMVLPIEKPC